MIDSWAQLLIGWAGTLCRCLWRCVSMRTVRIRAVHSCSPHTGQLMYRQNKSRWLSFLSLLVLTPPCSALCVCAVCFPSRCCPVFIGGSSVTNGVGTATSKRWESMLHHAIAPWCRNLVQIISQSLLWVITAVSTGHVTSCGARPVTSGCWRLTTVSGTLPVITCSSGESAEQLCWLLSSSSVYYSCSCFNKLPDG